MPAPSLDGTTILTEDTGGGFGYTFSTTKTTAGSNRMGFVSLSGLSFNALNGISATWGGVAMTLVSERYLSGGTNTTYAGLFRTSSQPSTAGSTVAIASGPIYCSAICFSLQDVDISGTPLGTPATPNDTETITVASATGELVIDVIADYNVVPTVGSGQTLVAGYQQGSLYFGGVSSEPGAASVVMDWTPSGSYVHLGVSVKPAGGAPPPSGGHDLPLLGVGKGLLPFWPAWWRYRRMQEKRIRQAARDCLRRHAA